MRISLVTPVLNNKERLAQTISWVLAADPGDLQYVIMDGGSTDGSVETAQQVIGRLHHFESKADGGVYDAINRGFQKTDGEIMGWLNAGDMVFPDALRIVREIFTAFPEVEWITSRILSFLDDSGRLVDQGMHSGIERQSFFRGEHLDGFSRGRSHSMIQQESTFWRRSLWLKAGGRLETRCQLAADFELWSRFFDHSQPVSVSAPLGAFRRHRDQLSQAHWPQYFREASEVLARRGATPRSAWRQNISVGFRKFMPAPIRRAAHAAHLFAPTRMCKFDHKTASWILLEY